MKILFGFLFAFTFGWLFYLSAVFLDYYDVSEKKFQVLAEALYVDISKEDYERVNGPDKSDPLYWIFDAYYRVTRSRV